MILHFSINFLPQVEVVSSVIDFRSSFDSGCQLKLFFGLKSTTSFMMFPGEFRDVDFNNDPAIVVASLPA